MYQIRASALSGWNDCPRRESVKLFKKIITDAGFSFQPREQSVGAAIGTGVHAGAAHALREKKAGRALVKISDIVDIGIESYRKEIADGVMYDTSSPTPDTCEKQIGNLTRAFMGEIFPNIEPLELEYAMETSLDEEFTLSGHVDIITKTAIDDLKFGSVKRKHQAQLGAYAYLAMKMGRSLPEVVRTIHIPRTPIAKPQEPANITVYNVKDCIVEASAVAKSIGNQFRAFLGCCDPMCFPSNPGSMLCSRRYCPAFGNKSWCKMGE